MSGTGMVPVLDLARLPRGSSHGCTLGGERVLLAHAQDGIYAVSNQCTHAAAPLAGGRINGHFIYCPAHGARFDLRTGKGTGLAMGDLKIFGVEVRDGAICVQI